MLSPKQSISPEASKLLNHIETTLDELENAYSSLAAGYEATSLEVPLGEEDVEEAGQKINNPSEAVTNAFEDPSVDTFATGIRALTQYLVRLNRLYTKEADYEALYYLRLELIELARMMVQQSKLDPSNISALEAILLPTMQQSIAKQNANHVSLIRALGPNTLTFLLGATSGGLALFFAMQFIYDFFTLLPTMHDSFDASLFHESMHHLRSSQGAYLYFELASLMLFGLATGIQMKLSTDWLRKNFHTKLPASNEDYSFRQWAQYSTYNAFRGFAVFSDITSLPFAVINSGLMLLNALWVSLYPHKDLNAEFEHCCPDENHCGADSLQSGCLEDLRQDFNDQATFNVFNGTFQALTYFSVGFTAAWAVLFATRTMNMALHKYLSQSETPVNSSTPLSIPSKLVNDVSPTKVTWRSNPAELSKSLARAFLAPPAKDLGKLDPPRSQLNLSDEIKRMTL